MSYNEQALAHHGVKGMRWGHRRFQNADGSLTPAGRQRYADNPKESRKTKRLQKAVDSVDNDIASFRPHERDGIKTRSGKTVMTSEDVKDSIRGLEQIRGQHQGKLDASRREDKFRATRKDISASRKTGHKLATNLLAGPFANRTYNSVIAAGGSRVAAAGITIAANLVGGPIGHLAVSALYTKSAGDGNLRNNFD